MRYCLVYYNKDVFNEIIGYYNDSIIKEITGYSKLKDYKHLNETSLYDIVEFTNHFTSEDDLKSFLQENFLLPEVYNGEFGILKQRGKNSEPKILPYGISFFQDRKYFNIDYLINIYTEYFKEPQFMKLFIAKHYRYLKNSPRFSAYLDYLKKSVDEYFENKRMPNDTWYALEKFIILYTESENKNGVKIEYFTRIRDLAMFAIDYERNYKVYEIETSRYSKEKLESELEYYNLLLIDEGISDEEKDAYQNHINKITKELETFERYPTRRRDFYGTTKN